jgi:hypothetical protein
MVGLAMATGYLFEGIIFGKAPPRRGGRKFAIDPERRAYLEGKQKAGGGGILRSIATAAGVALARDYATKIASGRGLSSRSAPSEDRSKVRSPYEL